MPSRQLPGYMIRFGVFEVDLHTGELRKHGIKVKLREQPFQILSLLLEQPGRVVTRDELQKRLWPADTFVDFDGGLNRAVNHLREALGDSADNPRFIETLPKRGYRFIASVEGPRNLESSPVPVVPPAMEPEPGAASPTARRHRRLWIIVSAATVVAIAAAGWLYPRRGQFAAERNLILLTEFENHTGDPAFDFTLKQALQIDLRQSPFLNILSDQQVTETLRQMGRNPEVSLAPQIARELCVRAGGKAVLGGSVVKLGNDYVLNLSATNCQTAEILGQEQVRATAKEEVLQGLDKATASLREKLGESLSSIRRFDRPFTDFITTSSLEAFQAYAEGQKVVHQKGRPFGIPFFRRATELDPNFALAYIQLGILYGLIGEPRLSAENTLKAYELRDRVSEWERFMISAQYNLNVTGQLEKVPPICEVWSQSYQDGAANERISWVYTELGQRENALSQIQLARRRRGELATTVNLLVKAYLSLDRYQDARTILDKMFAQSPDQLFWRQGIYLLAFFDGDDQRMEQQVVWAMKTPGTEDHLLGMHASTNAYYGRMEKARGFTRQAAEFAVRNDFRERAALLVANQALSESLFGNADAARQQVRAALNAVPGRDVRALAALALANAGEDLEAAKLANQLESEFPSSTIVQNYWLTSIRAAIDVHRGNQTHAIELLSASVPYELAETPTPLMPAYVRAQALLAANQGAAAVGEFQKILQRRGLLGNSVIAVLARLGLARAHMLSGEITKARSDYQNFLTTWKDADGNIPALQQAMVEYQKLN